jgi:hypothetical protein
MIREQVALNRGDLWSGGFESERDFKPLQLPETSHSLQEWRNHWSLSELLACYDRDFVQGAYFALLRRDPDMEGLQSRLRMLQSGEISRVELLFRLRYGPEGRNHRVRVPGLLKAFLIERAGRIPLAGIPIRYAVALARLPRMQRELEQVRGLMAMYKNDSDARDRTLAEFQNTELGRIIRQLENNN